MFHTLSVVRTSSHLTSGSYVTSTAVVRDASNALSNPPSCLEKSVKLSRFVDVTEKDEPECRVSVRFYINNRNG